MSSYLQKMGAWGEDQACKFLVRKGFVILDRNYHSTQGEIDIVARLAEDYYFIEVKTRNAGSLATDLSITSSKKNKFCKTVKHYCFKKNITEGSQIFAGLLVIINKATKLVRFRLAVFY